jgi:hypothetical protein
VHKGGQKILDNGNKMDINVEPHKKGDAKTYKTLLLKMALDNPNN